MGKREEKNNKPRKTVSAFESAALYIKENKAQSAALFTSLILGTTALATPLISTSLGAATMLGGSIWLLLQNSNTAVQNILALGTKLGMTTMFMGLLIGSINTAPEVMVSLSAALNGAIELGIGNVVGSNIAHTLLILGATAAIAGISKAKDMSWKFNTYVMAGAAGLFGVQLLTGTLSPVIGGVMAAAGIAYLGHRAYTVHKERNQHREEHHNDEKQSCEVGTCLFHEHDHDDAEELNALNRPKWLNTILAAGSIAGLYVASDHIVSSAVSFADKFNFSSAGIDFSFTQAAIGTVIVAIGTALPELSINIQAIKKKHSDLAIGNILGCSIINTLIAGSVLSFTGASVPDAFNPSTPMGLMNAAVFMGSAGLLTATLLATKGAIKKWMGALALTAYAAYVGASLYLSNGDMEHLHNHGQLQTQQIKQAENLSLESPKIEL